MEKQVINTPEMGKDFYLNSYEEAEEQYRENPTDQLLKQKLHYLKMMGWPSMAITSLDQAKEKWGLDSELVNNYISFYLKNNQYAELRELLATWGKLHELDEGMKEANIIAHRELSLRKEAIELLIDYLYHHDGADNEEFVAKQFLLLGDSLMSIYHFSKLYNLDPTRQSLVSQYVPLLLNVSQPQRAKEILLRSTAKDTTMRSSLLLARSLYELGEFSAAKRVLKSKYQPESYEQITQWFWNEKQWDSATYYVNRLIAMDSSRQWLFMKASIYEDRGWLNTSYDLFKYLAEIDSTDHLAQERAADVARKIAYLRELREASQKTPVLDLKPKRSLNDE